MAGIIENITQEDITISDDEKKHDRIPFLFVIRSLAKANKRMHCFIFGIQALSVWQQNAEVALHRNRCKYHREKKNYTGKNKDKLRKQYAAQQMNG